jgi:hypothetical protein
VTLALPFAAQTGDAIELEVAESDGKLTLAVVATRGKPSATSAWDESTATSLSRTGQLIGNLLARWRPRRARAASHGSAAERATSRLPPPPTSGRERVAAAARNRRSRRSGMFYEAHQAAMDRRAATDEGATACRSRRAN